MINLRLQKIKNHKNNFKGVFGEVLAKNSDCYSRSFGFWQNYDAKLAFGQTTIEESDTKRNNQHKWQESDNDGGVQRSHWLCHARRLDVANIHAEGNF